MPNIFFHKKTKDFEIHFEPYLADTSSIERKLSEKERIRLQKIKSPTRKKEWLTVRHILREKLMDEAEIGYHPSGKPFIENSGTHISISHSKGIAGIMTSNQRVCSIDCEIIHPKPAKLLERFAHQTEIEKIPTSKCEELATILWCAKECIYKLYSDISFNFVDDIICDIAPQSENQGIITCEVNTGSAKESIALSFELHQHYSFVWGTYPLTKKDS